MWLIIAKKEIKQAYRSRVIHVFAAFIWLLLAVAGIGGYSTYRSVSLQQQAAGRQFGEELAQRDRNPHSAAHFGTWLFKPATLLSLQDPGVNNYTGTTYRVEAHKQSEMNFSNARDSEGLMRFGELSLSAVLQLLLPLMIIFLCFSSVSREREEGTLRLLYAQGLTKRSLVWGKIWGNYCMVLLVALPAFSLIVLGNWLLDGGEFRAVLMTVFYALYFFGCVATSVLLSFFSGSSTASLIVQLSLWVATCILIPKLVASTAATRYPLPSYYQFSKAVDADFYNGVKGDSTYAQRRKQLQQETLARYKADSVSQLPINIDGLQLQAAEDYMTKVYRLQSVPVEQQLARQKRLFTLGAFISPYFAIRQLSRGLSGTDLYQHQYFHQQAATYRNEFVRTLNGELTKANPKDGEPTVSPTFLRSMNRFQYMEPSAGAIVQELRWVELAIICWLAAVLLLMEIAIRNRITPRRL